MTIFSDEWSQQGCSLNSDLSNASHTVCECNHLTHFAILLSPGLNISATHVVALQFIGYVGVSISVASMMLTVFMLCCFR